MLSEDQHLAGPDVAADLEAEGVAVEGQGGTPASSVKRVLKVPSDEQPTAKQTSVTLRSPRRSSAIARSMRRVIR